MIRAVGLFVFSLVLFFLPFLINSNLLLGRNNDIWWFWQSYSFFKDQLLNFHHLPLWQNQILSGSPYLGDPQNPLLYLPNYFSLLLPVPVFLLGFFFLHFFIAGLGMFCLSREMGFRWPAALFAALVYAFSPPFAAHLAEGHLNMLAAFAWFPFFLAGVYGLTTKPKIPLAVLTAVSASAIFFNYLTVFVYAVLAGAATVLINIKGLKKNFLFLAVGIFALISLPQILVGLAYFPLTTRDLMTIGDIFPQFLSTRKFIWSVINPYSYGLGNLGPETTLATGILPLLAATLGFVFVRTKYKILLLLFLPLALFLALNLKSPGYAWLVSAFPALLIFRVATRFWFVTILFVSLLGGYFLEKKIKFKFQLLLCALVFLELNFFARSYFAAKPSAHVSDTAFNQLLQPLLNRQEYFRIYCVTGCPGGVYLSNRGTASGYNPMQMRNYFDFLSVAAGYRFGSYSYALPPYQAFVDQPQPQSREMGLLGVKYIFSPYSLTDPGLALIASQDNWLLYENKNVLPRVFTAQDGEVKKLLVTRDLPGDMEIILDPKTTNVVINEPYQPLWQAVDQNLQSLPVRPYNQILVSVQTNNTTKLTVSFAPWMKILVGVSLLASLAGFGYLISRLRSALPRFCLPFRSGRSGGCNLRRIRANQN